MTTPSRDDLLNAFTEAEPLGPIAHERIAPDVLDAVVYDQIALFREVATKPHMLFLGRKGSGKSALLSQIRLGTQKRGRRGLLSHSDEPSKGRDYVIDVFSWEHFNQIVRNVTRHYRREDFIEDLIPPEFFAELWHQTLWDEIIHHFFNYYSFDDECRRALDPVNRYVNAESDLDGPIEKEARKVFEAARAAVLSFLGKRNSRLYFLFDSMENYPVRQPTFLRIISGLFQGLTKLNDDSNRVRVTFCIPEEIENFMTSGSGNLMKDFASSYRIRWKPVDLVRIIAHRLTLAASVHDPALHAHLKDLDFTARDQLHHAFNLILPPKVTNSRGTDEDPLAYIIRHTQLLPRHTLAIFNAALSRSFAATGSLMRVSEQSIRDGISAVEKQIAHQVLMPYEQLYPKLVAQCRIILPDVDPIVDFSTLRRIKTRFDRLVEDDVGSIWHKLFEMGVLGRSVTKSGADSPAPSPDSRYCYGQFHFNIDGAFSLPTDGEFCFHPVFSRAFGLIRRNGDNRVVYPAHINLEDVYADA